MAEDVKPEVIKKTQDLLGKFIKKPTLTEKLLKKPPFRFLHDICTSVMKETGFFEDVLNAPQDKIENIKDKEGKIMFLQKVIAAIENGSGIKLTVKPSKIVAGLEATKTNEMLQALGKAIEKQVEAKNSKNSQPNKAKPSKKPSSKEIKEEPPDKKKSSSSRNSKKVVENGVHEQSEEAIHSSRAPSSPKKKHSSKKIDEPESKPESKKLVEEKEKNGVVENKSPEKKERKNREEKANFFGAGESKDVPDVKYVTVNKANGQGDQDLNAKEEIIQETESKKGHSGKHKHRRSSIQSAADQAKISEALEDVEKAKHEEAEEKSTPEKTNKLENIIKDETVKTPSPSKQINYPKKDALVREGTIISRPRTGIRPTTARPASARPAAPRIRDRGEVAVAEEIIKPASGKVQVIEDNETNNEAEEENLISLETTNDIILEELSPSIPPINTNTEQEHGHLVEQILEAQRELEEDGKISEQNAQPKTQIEWESNKNKETTNKEMEKLRSSIQLLTRTANPLGKLLDFFQEDIDTVQKELEFWKEKNSTLSLQIAQEKSITDQYVEPLKIHLKELQQHIDEQLEQITVVKANIIRNDEKITKLLTGL